MKIQSLIKVVAVASLAGCASTPATSRNVSPDFSFSERSDLGLVVLSGRLSNDCKYGENPRATLFIYSDFDKLHPVGKVPLDAASSFGASAPASGVRFATRELRPGSYEIREVAFEHVSLIRTHLDIPFRVEAGKAVYLGEIHASLLNCNGFPAYNLQISDAWERDRQFLQDELKNVRPEEVAKAVVQCPEKVACTGPMP
ncbi:hypothetical protein [Myxococcus sp. RHSTA-1-4]|uniref:hypothetical protein n=1 Tax=Myxococcus sp. RHSTA-1-4 TaxID=2874601 RepID=UPI001CBB38A7|nr:hypothetical protein [Myxococcus sp. RHSTA-1-4]MBZ4417280.1 hypothetical protein [Myxococcus sp. RHSTA-1-4]